MSKPGKPRNPQRGLRHGEGYVTERPNGRWQARWWDGTSWRARTFREYDAAEDHVRAQARRLKRGEYIAPADMTVMDVIDGYLERAVHRLSSRTVLTYRSRAELMIAPSIGARRVSDIIAYDIQQWMHDHLAHGYNPSTVHAAAAVLTGALREAAILGILPTNPAAGIKRPRLPKPSSTTWTLEQARRVLFAVRDDPLFGALYQLALATGMRPGELRALKWEDVTLTPPRLIVRRTISRGLDGSEMIKDSTKTDAIRAIALSAEMAERLRWHRARQAERQLQHARWHDYDLVFDRGDGHWLYQSHWQRVHRLLCKDVDVPVIRAHDLRHTSATLELAAGTHPKIVSDRLGHSSTQMTIDRYQHVSEDLQRAAAEALELSLFGDNDAPSELIHSGTISAN